MVSEQDATMEWKADGIVSEGEYSRSMSSRPRPDRVIAAGICRSPEE